MLVLMYVDPKFMDLYILHAQGTSAPRLESKEEGEVYVPPKQVELVDIPLKLSEPVRTTTVAPSSRVPEPEPAKKSSVSQEGVVKIIGDLPSRELPLALARYVSTCIPDAFSSTSSSAPLPLSRHFLTHAQDVSCAALFRINVFQRGRMHVCREHSNMHGDALCNSNCYATVKQAMYAPMQLHRQSAVKHPRRPRSCPSASQVRLVHCSFFAWAAQHFLSLDRADTSSMLLSRTLSNPVADDRGSGLSCAPLYILGHAHALLKTSLVVSLTHT